ncbi:MAG TPA: DUF1080 domain-containing protein [Saprospiraceae bacterium]|nr:DUF1080 domain-containing protein [Saprospiraceae bacterium]
MIKNKVIRCFWMIGVLIIALPFNPIAQNKNDRFVSIFDGKTLNGWEGDIQYWRVENGNIVGEITPDKLVKNNTFLIWRGGEPKNFELKLEFRISKTGNSGINYRSEQITEVPFALKGYQADIDGMNRYTGQNYEERGRTTLAYRGQKTKIIGTDDPKASVKDHVKNNAWTKLEVTESLGDKEALQSLIKADDWNEVHLIVKDNRLQHYVNGTLMSDVTDDDKINRKMSGLIGVQVHVGPPMKVEYRNIKLKQ